jgi:hypothetical protein
MSTHTLTVHRHVAADPARVYEAVSDLARMASWSDEYAGSWRFWRGPARAGVHFVGWNRRGWRVWCTTCRVVSADRPDRFVFESGVLGLPIARWSYLIAASPDGGSDVTEAWDDLRGQGAAGAVARWLGRVFTGTTVEGRVQRNTTGMRATLEHLAAELEAVRR